jgi:ketosteroid isomerase-like protein
MNSSVAGYEKGQPPRDAHGGRMVTTHEMAHLLLVRTRKNSYRKAEEALIADDHSGVQTLLHSRVEASETKDIDQLMSLYSPDIVYYDVVQPLEFTGSEDVRRNFLRWFGEYDGPISLETHELNVAIDNDVAFAHMLHVDSGKRKNGIEGAVWIRSTVCCRRSNGKWLITHEHISMPGTWPASSEGAD